MSNVRFCICRLHVELVTPSSDDVGGIKSVDLSDYIAAMKTDSTWDVTVTYV